MSPTPSPACCSGIPIPRAWDSRCCLRAIRACAPRRFRSGGRVRDHHCGRQINPRLALQRPALSQSVCHQPRRPAGPVRGALKWKAQYYPGSSWFFPGHNCDANGPVDKGALAHALRRLHRKGLIKKKRTPHGTRAFYVTVRRSHGITDAQIAHEIGHTSGGSTLGKVYGGVPPEWLTGGGPKMSWLPAGKPAWESIKPPRVPRRPAQSTGAPAECPQPTLTA